MLLGRDRELAAIEDLLSGARASRSGGLVLRGEPGIGKSALLEHAVERAEGMRVLSATGVEAESELPFAGLHQLLWPVLDRVAGLPDMHPLATLAWLKGLRGDEEECRRLVAEVLDLATERGLALPAASATWALAQLEVAVGHWDEALVRLLALEEVRPGFGHPLLPFITTWDRVEAAVRLDRPDVAERSIERFETWTLATAPAWAAVVLDACRGLTAAPDQAEAHLEAALARLDDARPLDRARLQLHYGEHLRRERRRIDAREHLRAAVDAFERLGAHPWAERAARELRATGETARRRDVSPLAELTPQELQVAKLVGEGATNKAVAAQLFVSPKTVEYHLRKVFAKLGIASRNELIRLDLTAEEEVPA